MTITTRSSIFRKILLALLLLPTMVWLAPPARAGLTVDISLYHDTYGYYFYPYLNTNTTAPAYPTGTYLIASPQSPSGGSYLLYQATSTNFNQCLPNNCGGGNYYNSFDSLMAGITNGQWSIWVTNGNTTSQYLFTVAGSGLTSNEFGAPVVAVYPMNLENYVTNEPLIQWTGPASWPGTLSAQDYSVDSNGDYNYVASDDLSPSATTWTPSVELPDGTNALYITYQTDASAQVIASQPTNSAGQPISGWVSTATLEADFPNNILFNVALPPADSDVAPFLVARYNFEDTGNPYADSSGNNNNPDEIYEGNTNDTFSTNAAVGQYARLFFGDSDFAFDQSVPAYGNLSNALTGNFSVTAWVSTTNTEGEDYNSADYGAPVFFGASDYNNHCTAPLTITGSKAAFTIISSDGPGTVTIHSTTSVNDGHYHFLAVTRQQTTGLMSLYVDGNLEATGTGITDPVITQGWIAVAQGNGYYYAGLLDDVRIYSTNLSAGDVSAIQSEGNIVSLATAIGTTGLATSTSGDSDWTVESTNTYNGTPYAAVSGIVTDDDSSTLSVTVTGPGTLTFYWSSLDGCDDFDYEFDVDGNYTNDIYCSQSWEQQGPFPLPAGQHVLSWTAYDADEAYEVGFLDQVSWVPTVVPGLTVTALPQSGPAPLAVQFTSPPVDSNGNTVTNWHWTFGDGGSSPAQSPSHTYTNIGSYSPTLTAYSTGGSSALTVSGPGTITVTPPPPPTGNWINTGAIPTSERFAFPLTVLPNGEVLASGGEAVFQVFTYYESDLYSPTNGTWQETGFMNYAREGHTATLLTNGVVLAAGGVTAGAGGGTLSTCEIYNPATALWTNTASMAAGRYGHTAVLLTNGFVLVAGGISNSVTWASSELYNPGTGAWTPSGNLNTARAFASAFLLTNGTVLVVGGQGTNSTILSSAEIYNPGTGLWRYTASPMLLSQYQSISQLLTNGQVLVAGGLTNGNTVSGFSELYNPVSDSWSQTGSMNTPRESAGSVLLNNGIVLVAGGSNDGNNNLTNAELYDPAGGFWTVTGSMNEGRNGPFPIVLLADGQALATGGLPANNDLSTGTAELYTTLVPTIRIVNPTRLAGGAFEFSFTNTPGAGSTVFSTTNMGLPIASWTTLGGATEVSPGKFQFTDTHATNNSKRFYRVRSP